MPTLYQRPLLATLRARVEEPRKFFQVIVGPRQVGKTTLVEQLLDELKSQEQHAPAPQRLINSLSADGKAALGPSWIGLMWQAFRQKMQLSGYEEGLLVFDEIQKIPGWSEEIKRNWDADTKNHVNIKLIILGSSRLLVQKGLSEALTGRFELNYLGHWSYPEMRDAFGFSPEQYVWFGGYPGAAEYINDETRFKNYVLNSIIEPSISNDILMMEAITKPALLRQLFDLAISYSAQILSYNKMLGQLQDAGNTTTLAHYLDLLGQAGLITGLEGYSTHPIKTRRTSPKLQVQNAALFSALHTESFDEARMNPDFWGRVVESAIGAHLIAALQQIPNAKLYYWRDGSKEVDFVIKRSAHITGIEVKTASGFGALETFGERFPEAESILVGDDGIDYSLFLTVPLEKMLQTGSVNAVQAQLQQEMKRDGALHATEKSGDGWIAHVIEDYS